MVRVGPNRLSFRTKEALRDIYIDRKANLIKAGLSNVVPELAGSTQLQHIKDRSLANSRRRQVGHALSEDAIRSAEPFIIEHIRDWFEKLAVGSDQDGWSKTRNMKDWTQYLMVDILGSLAFGASFHAMEKENSALADSLDEAFKLCMKVSCSIFDHPD